MERERFFVDHGYADLKYDLRRIPSKHRHSITPAIPARQRDLPATDSPSAIHSDLPTALAA